MKRSFFYMLLLLALCTTAKAQTFKGHFLNDEYKIQMELNLYNDSIPVPGIDDEKCNVELTIGEDGKLVMRQLKDAYIKTISNKKYVKLPKTVEFHP